VENISVFKPGIFWFCLPNVGVKGDAHSVRSPMVNDEWLRRVYWLASAFLSVLRHCWLGDKKDIWPVEKPRAINKWRKTLGEPAEPGLLEYSR